MRGAAEAALTVLVALALAASAAAQSEAPRAPRIIPVPGDAPAAAAEEPAAPPRVGPLRPPSATPLAALPEERGDAIDEIIVIGEGWRLPDLGSEWRARQEETARQARFNAILLPLYDPSRPPQRSERLLTGEERRHGYIELFRLRFGRRARDDEAEEP